MNPVIILLYGSVVAILYYFVLFPFMLWIGGRLKFGSEQVRDKAGEESLPSVTLLISAYNEERIIHEKLKNALSLDYPKEKLEVVVVSDASDDATDDLVKSFPDHRVKLLRQSTRKGKTAALNQAMTLVTGEIVVFSDANSMFEKEALKQLTSSFNDPKIGFVTGVTRYISRQGKEAVETTGLYSKLEILIKKLESRFGLCVGADGAIFAIRKVLYRPLQAWDINDFVIPLQIIEAGYYGKQNTQAVCIEESAKDMHGEFQRQVRITSRTLRAVLQYRNLLNPFKYTLFSFFLFSHKVMKFSLPFFLALLFIANSLLLSHGAIYVWTFIAQAGFYFLGCNRVTCITRQVSFFNRINSIAHAFCLVILAYLLGWWKLISGETFATWDPNRHA